jgi:putative DNA primase/helicase
LTTNHKPIVKGTDAGIWRRLRLVPFLTTIAPDDRDPFFRQKVLNELPGILNWALAGLKSYDRVGLGAPRAVASATEEYHHNMDFVGLWLEERTERDPGSELPTTALYQSYKEWADKQIGFAMSVVAFGRELSGRGFEPKKVKKSRGFRGLKLVAPPM